MSAGRAMGVPCLSRWAPEQFGMPRLLPFKTFNMGIDEETCTASYVGLVKTAIGDFREDRALRLAAALSFYTVLSFAPLLLIVVGLAGFVGVSEAFRQEIDDQLRTLIGPAGGELARVVLEHADEPRKGVISIIVGLATILFGATGVFVQLQEALNTIWEVQRRPGSGFWNLVRKRLLSFAMVLAIGFLLLVSLVLSAAITLVQSKIATEQGWFWQPANTGVSMIVVTVLFGLMYKILPDAKIAWGDVVIGAVLTGLLMTLGKYAIGLYLGHSSVGSAYGAAGSLMVLLVWVYYSAIIVLFGAELTQVYAHHRGRGIESRTHAQRNS